MSTRQITNNLNRHNFNADEKSISAASHQKSYSHRSWRHPFLYGHINQPDVRGLLMPGERKKKKGNLRIKRTPWIRTTTAAPFCFSTSPFFLIISLSEGESRWVSATQMKMSPCGLCHTWILYSSPRRRRRAFSHTDTIFILSLSVFPLGGGKKKGVL